MEPYGQGLLLVFDGQAGEPPAVREEGRVLFNAYTETKRWNELIGVGTVPDLNDLCLGDRIKHVIRIAEGQQEKKIAELADRIAARRDELRVVCIAGPSSSGKTTFVKRLSIQLEVNGITPRTLSLDDYYVDREKTPLDEDGDFDFEALEAIDLPLFLPHLKALVDGQEVLTPVYEFRVGQRKPEAEWRLRTLGKNEVLLIEGIHAPEPAPDRERRREPEVPDLHQRPDAALHRRPQPDPDERRAPAPADRPRPEVPQLLAPRRRSCAGRRCAPARRSTSSRSRSAATRCSTRRSPTRRPS